MSFEQVEVSEGQMTPTEESEPKEMSPADSRLAKQVVNELITRGVKVLALDFDKTIVSVHTAGLWRQGTPRLAEHVRPCFRELMRAALDSSLHVCVVTYSMQPQLIRDVIKTVLPRSDVSRMLIRANAGWLQTLNSPNLGKQEHIAWIVTELFNRKHAIIHSPEILLLDDDAKNVELAVEFGHQGYEVPEDVSLESIWSYVQTVEVKLDLCLE